MRIKVARLATITAVALLCVKSPAYGQGLTGTANSIASQTRIITQANNNILLPNDAVQSTNAGNLSNSAGLVSVVAFGNWRVHAASPGHRFHHKVFDHKAFDHNRRVAAPEGGAPLLYLLLAALACFGTLYIRARQQMRARGRAVVSGH